jgi:hypothetical protein
MESANVDEAVPLGQKQLVKFEEQWPKGFYTQIKK